MVEPSVTGRTWVQRPVDGALAGDLARQFGLPAVAARCLAARAGSFAGAWLEPSPAHFHDPLAMLGMGAAVDRVRRAVRDGERIRIVTDYDVDGTTSSLILKGALYALGAAGRVDCHIPDRMDEGYGLSLRAARRAGEDGVALLLTADIGVRDHAAVALAAEGGVDVVICDHHLPEGASVPAAARAVLCPPQAGCTYPNRALAACGVSFKLAQALLEDHPRGGPILRSMLKVAAIGTVADVVDLATLENRAIVSLGLEELRRGPHAPGPRAGAVHQDTPRCRANHGMSVFRPQSETRPARDYSVHNVAAFSQAAHKLSTFRNHRRLPVTRRAASVASDAPAFARPLNSPPKLRRPP